MSQSWHIKWKRALTSGGRRADTGVLDLGFSHRSYPSFPTNKRQDGMVCGTWRRQNGEEEPAGEGGG